MTIYEDLLSAKRKEIKEVRRYLKCKSDDLVKKWKDVEAAARKRAKLEALHRIMQEEAQNKDVHGE